MTNLGTVLVIPEVETVADVSTYIIQTTATFDVGRFLAGNPWAPSGSPPISPMLCRGRLEDAEKLAAEWAEKQAGSAAWSISKVLPDGRVELVREWKKEAVKIETGGLHCVLL